MAENSPTYVLTADAYSRLLRVLRWAEPQIRADGYEEETKDIDDSAVTIQITGPAVEMDSVVSPGEETLETDDGEPLEMDPGEDLDLDPAEVEKRYIWPCEFVYRNMEALGTDEEWGNFETPCWAYELNEASLMDGARYQAVSVGSLEQGEDEEAETRALVQVQTGGSGTEIIRVTGKPKAGPAGRRWYPGVISQEEEDSWHRADGLAVWLLQVVDGELATNGWGYYTAIRRAGSAIVNSESRPVYETSLLRQLTGGFCDTITHEWFGIFQGEFEGDEA